MNLNVELACACARRNPAVDGLLVEARGELETAEEEVVAHVAAVLARDRRGCSQIG